ncbi:hypothetical protein B0H66DRAFT_597981 [Apodospora peruviana]|uniref:SPT2 chromatin protein n=1 Tax=Apodospora peruviana TaxID=516989 RepID=A0AAE0ITT8_9PEZI|nr:hypothetical protein B0H66DRAFT_597981 [Apodospora peruviana]
MPISDLLASISGEKPANPSTTQTRPISAIPKRKAEDEPHSAAAKTRRTVSPPNGFSQQNGYSSKPPPRPITKPTGSLGDKPASSPRPSTYQSSAASHRPGSTPARSGGNSASTSSSRGLLPSRPLANSPTTTASGQTSQPKKRSFAEIMARAKEQTAQREQFGKIQHKPVEKGLTMKERKEQKAAEARQLKKTGRSLQARNGGTVAGPRSGASGESLPRSKAATGKPVSAPVGEVKKVKKAALATTGYTGTARPRPGATVSKSGSAAKPALDTGSRDRAPYSGALSRSRRDYYDDEMDDFIEYDDDEEEPGPGRRGGYDSLGEDESDMEAGLTDIEEEDRRAEMAARREDKEQELLEARLKREKEEKRRRLLGATR